MSDLYGDSEVRELKDRLIADPVFAHLFRSVYATIVDGRVSIEDWRQAVNLAFTRWHSVNVQPIYFIQPPDATGSPCGHETWRAGCSYCEDRRASVFAALQSGAST